MIEKKIREAEFTRQHTLSPEQLKKLLEGKMARAKRYYEAVSQKREVIKIADWIAKCEYTGNEVLAPHYKHGANGRRLGWNPSSGTKNQFVLKHIGDKLGTVCRRNASSSMF